MYKCSHIFKDRETERQTDRQRLTFPILTNLEQKSIGKPISLMVEINIIDATTATVAEHCPISAEYKCIPHISDFDRLTFFSP